jgi:hypothetical protein
LLLLLIYETKLLCKEPVKNEKHQLIN